jgi:hypothetical protein
MKLHSGEQECRQKRVTILRTYGFFQGGRETVAQQEWLLGSIAIDLGLKFAPALVGSYLDV